MARLFRWLRVKWWAFRKAYKRLHSARPTWYDIEQDRSIW